MGKIIISEVTCSLCHKSKQFQKEYDTEDEELAKEMSKNDFQLEIMEFEQNHSEHKKVIIEKYEPCGLENPIRQAVMKCNRFIFEKYGHIQSE